MSKQIEPIDFDQLNGAVTGLVLEDAVKVMLLNLFEKVNEIIEVVNDYTKDA